jgi:hypothetical protein
MSFTALRAARQPKENKSYVNAPNTPSNTAPTVPASEGSFHQENEILGVLRGTHSSLPTQLDIQTSSTSGRGLFVKEKFKPGSLALFLCLVYHLNCHSRFHPCLYSTACIRPVESISRLVLHCLCKTFFSWRPQTVHSMSDGMVL